MFTLCRVTAPLKNWYFQSIVAYLRHTFIPTAAEVTHAFPQRQVVVRSKYAGTF